MNLHRWTRRVQRVGSLLSLGLAWACHASVELNQAPPAELRVFKGLGPATVERIVQARQRQPFRDWADLTERVRGIGPRKAAQLSDQGLTVQGQRYGEVGDPPARPWVPFQPRPLLPWPP